MIKKRPTIEIQAGFAESAEIQVEVERYLRLGYQVVLDEISDNIHRIRLEKKEVKDASL